MKRRTLLLLALPLLALLALGFTFVPARLPVAVSGVTTLPAAAPPAEMRISGLPTGSMRARAAFAFRGGSFDDEREFAQTAILIQHPKGDLLIDTGMGSHAATHFEATPAIMQKLSNLSLGTPAQAQLERNGYDWRKLHGIVPTHVHWDHISGLPDFPGVAIWLNDAQARFTQNGGVISALMRSFEGLKTHAYGFEDGPYLGFSHSFDVFEDGSVVIVPAPGHTPGSILVFVALPSGMRFGLLGDLVWQAEGVTRPAEKPWLSRVLVDQDAGAVREMISRIAGLHARFPEIRWLPAHDARAMASVPHFPDGLQ